MSARLVTAIGTSALLVLALGTQGCSKKKGSSVVLSSTAPAASNTGTTAPSTTSTPPASTAPTPTSATGTTPPPATPPPATPPPPPPHPGSGTFVDGSGGFPDSDLYDWTVDAGDVDNDNDNDLVIGTYDGVTRVMLNMGQGVFQDAPAAFPDIVMKSADIHLRDVDNDNDLDVIVASNFQPVRVFKNDGTGNFTLSGEYDTDNTCFTYKVAIADVNNDAYIDIFMANAGQATATQGQNVLLMNDTTGNFSEAPGAIPPMNDDSIGAVFVDVNADNYMDLLVVNFVGGHRLLVNDTTGIYANQTDAYLPAGMDTSPGGTAATIGDFNKDGRVDIFIANEGLGVNGSLPVGKKNTLLLKDASGRYVDASGALPDHAEASFQVRAADLDADGYLDLVVSNLRAVQRIYRNVNGQFVDMTANLPTVNDGTGDSLGNAIADLDGDRTPDIVFTRRNTTTRGGFKPFLFLNVPKGPLP